MSRTRPVPEVEQQPRCCGCASHLVHVDDRHDGLSRVVDRDERNVDQAAVELARDPVLPGVDENTLDALALQLVECSQHGSAVRRREPSDAHEVPVRVSGALKSAQHRGRSDPYEVDADDPERLRPTGDQHLRRGVRAKVQLAHRRQHPLACVLAHVFACVDDARDGLLRDASGRLGHVNHRWGPSPDRALRFSLDELTCRSMTHPPVASL